MLRIKSIWGKKLTETDKKINSFEHFKAKWGNYEKKNKSLP